MMMGCDATHDPELTSWLESANRPDHDFPIQNLPFGRFRPIGSDAPPRIGVAIGDAILDIGAIELIHTHDMNALMAWPLTQRRRLRAVLSAGLQAGSTRQPHWEAAMMPAAEAEMLLPCRIGDYTDFYSSIYHARTVGALFRPGQPLLPNYMWLPVGYHGRASSVTVSGSAFARPCGQCMPPGRDSPVLGPSERLDYEVELGFWVGRGNALGQRVGVGQAEVHWFGVSLLNDWSARDIQAWEYQPLGPFLSKSFASSVSPWVITTDALAPFRAPLQRPAHDSPLLPYLDDPGTRAAGALDITLEVSLQTAAMQARGLAPHCLSRCNSAQAAYWTIAQLLAHHTVNGCNLRPGDLLGSGTLSGPAPSEAGSLLELTQGGKQALTLPSGERRTFLQDGDTVILRGWCARPGAVRIGLGEVRGTVLPARLP